MPKSRSKPRSPGASRPRRRRRAASSDGAGSRADELAATAEPLPQECPATHEPSDPEAPVDVPVGLAIGLVSEEFAIALARRVLEQRGTLDKSLANRLSRHLRALPVPGFRDASKAKPAQLAGPVIDAVARGDDLLAVALFEAWLQTEAPLREAAAAAMSEAGVPADSGWTRGVFPATWDIDEWGDCRDAVVQRLPDTDRDAAGLMLTLLAGRMPLEAPGPPLELAPRLLAWLEEIDDLPYEAEEWADVPQFATALLVLWEMKCEAQDAAAFIECDACVQGIGEEFGDELRYLDIDLGPWTAQKDRDPEATLALAKSLGAVLAEYRPVRPQGASRTEEAARVPERERLETMVFDLLAKWEALPIETPGEEDPAHAEEADAPTPEQVAELRQERDAARAENAKLEVAKTRLEDEGERLRADNEVLRLAKEQRDGEIGALKGELATAQASEEHWRQAYVAARKAGADTDGNGADAPEIENVRAAIALAERAFPDTLAFALNGKSNPNVPFAKPGEVFDALAWLATGYRRRDADSIQEACPGWFYKTDQSESTVGMYPEWYQASLEGKTYAIGNHIGKGNSFDPRSTIRIGFAWDEERERVIVGYVGQHQRNRQS